MRSVQFGRSLQFVSSATTTSVAISGNTVLEVHDSNSTSDRTWYTLGTANGATVDWGNLTAFEPYYDASLGVVEPACALVDAQTPIVIHRGGSDNKLAYRVGNIRNGAINWGLSIPINDTGAMPRIAANARGQVVEVHQSRPGNFQLYLRAGQYNATTRLIAWGPVSQIAPNGARPFVTINDNGQVVIGYADEFSTMYYRVGTMAAGATTVTWEGDTQIETGSGTSTSIALTADGMVVEVHQKVDTMSLWSRTGMVTGGKIQWVSRAAGALFDDGILPSVAVSGSVAIQVHKSQGAQTLWYSTSLVIDRATWMTTNAPALQSMTLKQLTVSGSHNAAFYETKDDNTYNRDQNLTVNEQLEQGVRWMDIRLKWTGSEVVVHHSGVFGQTLQTVLDQVAAFVKVPGRAELVTLDFSHLDGWTPSATQALETQLVATLGSWLWTRHQSEGRALASIPMSSFLGGRSRVIALMDDSGFTDKPDMIFLYANTLDPQRASKADIVGFDQGPATDNTQEMAGSRMQNFAVYNGVCPGNPSVACQLFLLGWGETGSKSDFDRAMSDDCRLGNDMAHIPYPNAGGFSINVINLDFTQSARPVDVCLALMGLHPARSR